MTAAVQITEAEFQAQVVELAGFYQWEHLHVRRSIGRGRKHVTATNIAGWPDLLLWRPGRIVAAELKSETGSPSVAQLAVLASLEAAGAEVYLWKPSDLEAIARVLR